MEKAAVLEREIKEWRAQWRQKNGGRDPAPGDLPSDLRAKMLELKSVRAAAQRGQAAQPADENRNCANQTAAAPRRQKQAAGGQQKHTVREPAVVDSDGEQPSGRVQPNWRGGGEIDYEEEITSDTECRSALPLPWAPALMPAAIPVTFPEGPRAAPGPAAPQNGFTRALARHAAPTARRELREGRPQPAIFSVAPGELANAGGAASASTAVNAGAAAPAAPSPAPASGTQQPSAPQADITSNAGAAGPSKRPRLAGAAFLGRRPLAPQPPQQVQASTAAGPQQAMAPLQASTTAAAAGIASDPERQEAPGQVRQQVQQMAERDASQQAPASSPAAGAAAAEAEAVREGAVASRAAGPRSRPVRAARAEQVAGPETAPPAIIAAGIASAGTSNSGVATRKRSASPTPLERPVPVPAQLNRGPASTQIHSGSAASSGSAGSTAKAGGPSNVVLTRTEEGLNVMYVKRQAAAPEGTGGSKGGKGGPNSGWGNNFVRYDMKKGKGSTSYKSSRHSFKKRRGGGRGGGRGWGRGASRLRQVGDGADFLEGWADPKSRCFKCGGSGHWAKDCTQQQQQQVEPGPGELDLGGSDSEEEEEGATRARALAALGLPTQQPQQQQQQQQQCPGPGASVAAGIPAAHGGASGAPPGPPAQAAAGSAAAAAAEAAAAAAAAASQSEGAPSAGTVAANSIAQVPEHFAAAAEDPSEEALLGVLGEVFGFGAFRGLQLATIQRLLMGESILSIMPTGMGKSLCYQLPALLLPGITLVVSPLIALMHDQRASLPQQLSSAVLWSGQTKAEALQVLADVKAGLIKVLFVSPERLGNPHLLAALQPHMPLPLVVIDEAHCVAEWGHSFRPAYFRLGWALRNSVRASRVLALTATATKATESAVLSVLGIPPSAVLRDSCVRENLRLHVLRKGAGASSHATWDDILSLFREGGRLAAVRSAIVYCAYKDDADRLAQRLNAYGVRAAPYHAGRHLRERAAVEADFIGGRLRVVVATVAFGMGINVRSVGAVVHATMPRSLEEYVQQVGRAGRDGGEASCFAYLSDADFVKLRTLAYSGLLERDTVRAFLDVLFQEEAPPKQPKAKGRGRKCKQPAAAGAEAEPDSGLEEDASKEEGEGEEENKALAADEAQPAARMQAASAAASEQEPALEEKGNDEEGSNGGGCGGPGQLRFGVLSSRKLSTQLDMREESMETMLSYMESGSNWLRVLPNTAVSVRVSFYAATAQQLAPAHPVVQVLLQVCPNARKGLYSAQLGKLGTAAQRPPGVLLQELREMAAANLIAFELSKEEGPAYEVLRVPGDLGGLAEELHSRLTTVLRCQVARLDTAYRAFAAAVAEAGGQAAQEVVLRQAVAAYFEREQQQEEGLVAAGALLQQQAGQGQAAAGSSGGGAGPSSSSSSWVSNTQLLSLDLAGLPLKPATPELLHAARAVLRRNAEKGGPPLSPLALARVLAGLSSPANPAKAACKMFGSFWGCHSGSDFGVVLRAAEIAMRDARA